MWRWTLRWLKRFAITLLVLSVVSVAAALIALHTDWGRERLRRVAEAELRAAFPGGATIGRIEGSVLGELVVRDVELRAADGEATYAKIGALRIEISIAPLLGRTVRIARLGAEDVELYPQREIAPPEPEEEAAESGPGAWSVELPEIEVRRARVVIEAGPAPVTLEGVDLTAAVAMPAAGPMSVAARLVRGTWRERGAAIEGSAVARIGGEGGVVLPRFDVRVGGVAVRGTDVAVDPARPAGKLEIGAPARALRQLVPEVVLPADARVAVTATRAPGGELALELAGALGASKLSGKLRADLARPRVRGVISTQHVALDEVTRGAAAGSARAIVAFVADRARVRGTVIASGGVEELPEGEAIVSFDVALGELGALGGAGGAGTGTGKGAGAAGLDVIAGAAGLVLAAGADGSSARAFARLSRRGGALAIETGRVAAATPDASGLAGKDAGIRGGLALDAALAGTALPLDASVRGTLEGAGVEYGETRADALRAGRLRADFRGAAKGSLAGVTGEATGWIRGITDAGAPRGDADFGARLRGDRTIAAWVKARPGVAGLALDANATLSFRAAPGGEGVVTTVALGEHAIAVPGGERWTGRGGRVVIDPARVTLTGLRTTNQGGKVDVGATFDLETERLALSLDAAGVTAASIHPAYRGAASGAIRLERRGTRWDGTVALDGRGLAFAPDASPIDAELRVEVAGRRVTLESGARTAALGGVRFDLDVDGPADLTDPDGWRRLPRAAVRSMRLGVDHANLAAAAVPTGGVVDGSVYIAGAETTGTMRVRGMRTPLGDVEGDVTFRPEAQGLLGATSTVRVTGLGDADVAALIAFPPHPFDPAAWQALGRGALARLGASFTDISIDPARLAQLGLEDAPYRGQADVAVVLAGGSTSATVEVDVTGVSGGPIARPLELHVSAKVDPKDGTRVRGEVVDPAGPAPQMLASFEGAIPSFTLDRWIAAPEQARHAQIAGGLVAVPGRGPDGEPAAAALSARALLAVLGRRDLAAGTIAGTVTIGGTVGTPTAKADLALAGLLPAYRVPGKPAPRPTDLTIEARWGGAAGRVAITGRNAASAGSAAGAGAGSAAAGAAVGSVSASAEGDPTNLASVTGRISATDFDLAPIAVFLPDDLTAVEGKLRGSLTARGLDSAGKLRGYLEVTQAVVPLDPMLGKLREGTARVTFADRGLALTADGALGGGRISLRAESPGHDLAALEATGRLDDVSPLAEWEPVIDADVAASFRRTGEQWAGTVKIRNASAVLPPSGSDLGDPTKPSDLLFVEDGEAAPRLLLLSGRAPDLAWLVADIEIEPMAVKAEDLFDTRGEIAGRLQLKVGDAIGLVGRIDIDNGIVGDLFGRRYTATGNATFSGSLVPYVDVTLQHKFPEFSLLVKLEGDPDTIKPRFSSDPPGTYSADQLAGFFIGGKPGGDPSEQTREAATGAGAAVLSSALGARIRKRLPIKIEQLGCDPGNSATEASCTIGRWFGDKLFVAFKRRIDVPENAGVNANEVQGQYYLRRDLYLEVIGGDGGTGGLDLLWRRRW